MILNNLKSRSLLSPAKRKTLLYTRVNIITLNEKTKERNPPFINAENHSKMAMERLKNAQAGLKYSTIRRQKSKSILISSYVK